MTNGTYGKEHRKDGAKKAVPVLASAFLWIYASFLYCFFASENTAEKKSEKYEPAIFGETFKESPAAVLQNQIILPTPDAVDAQPPPAESGIVPPQAAPAFEALPGLAVSAVTLYDAQTGKTLKYSQEDYVTGAVLSEMPISFGHEALRAQAIACRTYALYNILRGREHPDGAQLCTDPAHCQAFCAPESASEEKLSAVSAAVQSTAGEIMLYDGAPILAVFHASSGRKTKSSAEVWGGELSYLVSVETPEWQINDGVINKDYTFSVSEFSSRIRALCELSEFSEQQITNNITAQKADSGKVTGVSVCGTFISGTDFAKALGLRTADFDIYCDGKNITVTCYGYGHGVGLSQYGAREMARMGANCYDILSHYYSGITFSKTSGV